MSHQDHVPNHRPVVLNPRSRYCPAAALAPTSAPRQYGRVAPFKLIAPNNAYSPYRKAVAPQHSIAHPVTNRLGNYRSTPSHRLESPYIKSQPRGGAAVVSSSRDPLCEICSGGPEGNVYHYHVSTEYERMKACSDGNSVKFCRICVKIHDTNIPCTRNVVFTSSTLINFWRDRDWATDMHFDVEAIVGGTVRDGIKSLELMFNNNPAPINAVICLGINDILKNRPVEDIVQDLYTFQQLIRNHSIRYKHSELGLEKNIPVICPLIRPPKCVKLNRLFDPPTPDKSDEINRVNAEIRNLNETAGVRVPVYLNLMGIRDGKKGQTNHRFKEWREDELRHKLHLCSALKCHVAKKIAMYFQKCAQK